MNLSGLKTIARKELRSAFLSPVAPVFLAVYLLVTLFIFFTYAKFFGRNLADVRPLFSWLPVLLIFLVSAVTMRQWSEEQKMGTLELLLTLPVKTADLVLGKFVAGMLLVGLALALTLPLPISVAMLGDLDWGPVLGGYVAAILLASTYMAVGLCVSARTDNQIVALMVTALVCSGLYLLGADAVAGVMSQGAADILRALGTGSRFASIERGVLDVRDLAYYVSLTAFFLTLNVYFLEAKRHDQQPGGRRRMALRGVVVLAALNAVALNLWLAPITAARADLTADGEYSVSDVTRAVLAELNEPLVIVGYFSEKTHPLLAPLVPRVRDFLREYELSGHGHVKLSFVDPTQDDDAQAEISELYDVKSVPLRISGRHEESVVNAYFHILIRYGDQVKVLSFGDLIDVHVEETDVQVRLRNLEYEITRTIKKVTGGFQSIESVLAQSGAQVKLTAYITPKTLPPELAKAPELVRETCEALKRSTGGRFKFEVLDPTDDDAMQRRLLLGYGIQALAADEIGKGRFFLHFVIESGDIVEPVFPQFTATKAGVRGAIEAGIKRTTPGFLKTIGLLSAEAEAAKQQNPFAPKARRRLGFRAMERALKDDFTVKRLKLTTGAVPSDIDVLIVAKTGQLTPTQMYAIDQYLMRGGAVIALTGAYTVEPSRTALLSHPQDHSLLNLLETYGVNVGESFVMDPQNAPFPVVVPTGKGDVRVQLMPYPFFPDVRADGFTQGHVAVAGVPSVALAWASPVSLGQLPKDVHGEVLLRSSSESWLQEGSSLEPDFKAFPRRGFGRTDQAKGRQPLAVTLKGRFKSFFADRPSPLVKQVKGEVAQGIELDLTGRSLKVATADARLAVVGSGEFADDFVAELANESGGGQFRGNGILVRNLVDWALEDTDLLSIRTAGAFARTLRPMSSEERTTYELANYLVVLLALGGVVLVAVTRRRMARPIRLTPEARS